MNSRHHSRTWSEKVNFVINAIDSPPTCHLWDDFFDFSRMSWPKNEWVIARRLEKNVLVRYLGNYIWIWIFAQIIVGILFSKGYLLAIVVTFVLWSLLSVSTVHAKSIINGKKPTYDIPTDEKLFLFVLFEHIFLFLSGLLKLMYITSVIIGIMIIIHSSVRPVAIEVSSNRKTKVVMPDGFIDDPDVDGDETFVFQKENRVNHSSLLKPPGSVTQKKSISQELHIPLAVGEDTYQAS